MNKIAILVFGCVFVPFSVLAQTYQLGEPQFAGAGCPAGTTGISVSPDRSSVSVLFDQFHLEIANDAQTNRTLGCSIVVPMTVSPGYVVETTAVDFRGFASLPDRAILKLATSGLQSTDRFSPRFTAVSAAFGPSQDSVFFHQDVQQTRPGTPSCPQAQALRLNIQAIFSSQYARGRGPPALGGAQFTLDSSDIGSSGLTLAIKLRACRP